MKQITQKISAALFMAAALIAMGAATGMQAQTALRGDLALRPLTPQEVKDHNLTGAQVASGMSTVGVGVPVHLEARVNIALPATEIVRVDWTIVSKPIGSEAVLADSPLGADVPIHAPADRLIYQVAERKFLRPDMRGQYTVEATIVSANSGEATLSKTITAGIFMGIDTCTLCHSGGLGAPNMVTEWANTGHATKFTRDIDGLGSSHFNSNCVECHTVGYDDHADAMNGGFDDIAVEHGWTFPDLLVEGNWAAMPDDLKNVSNIQCENCHGPGSEHAYSFGHTDKISVTFDEANCAQCHDSLDHHSKNAEWYNSAHATVTSYPTGPSRAGCVSCHSGQGFVDHVEGVSPLRTAYEPIGCATCHDPHSGENPHQLRGLEPVTLKDNITTIADGGAGTTCMNCHMARQDAEAYVETAGASSHFGPHYGSQTDMLMGANAVEYGKEIASSAAHRDIEDTCVACHMQELGPDDPAFTSAGSHTFSLAWDSPDGKVELTSACTDCHGDLPSFDFPREDYDGDGIVEGVQTEVDGLLHKLGRMLPPIGDPAVVVSSSYTRQELRAAYNHKYVYYDGSHGIHNLPYAVGILKASIDDLTNDANNDGIADWWQTLYFGSIADPRGAPHQNPTGDGIPNWLKYSLGLDPTVAGMEVPNGVVWANESGSQLDEADIRIYTAAEVVFNTEVGRTYQLQAISSLGGGWQNVGAPIAGSGSSFSFMTPTRNNDQQFFRVTSY